MEQNQNNQENQKKEQDKMKEVENFVNSLIDIKISQLKEMLSKGELIFTKRKRGRPPKHEPQEEPQELEEKEQEPVEKEKMEKNILDWFRS